MPRTISRTISTPVRLRTAVLALTALLGLAACSDPTGPRSPAGAVAASLLRVGAQGSKPGGVGDVNGNS